MALDSGRGCKNSEHRSRIHSHWFHAEKYPKVFLRVNCSPSPLNSPRPGLPGLFVLPHEWEFALEEGRLNGICILAGAGDFGGLPASEGNFVNEVFASGWATRFPRYEDMGRDKAADGRG